MAVESSPYEKVSLTVPTDVLDKVRARVERGQMSAYFADAVRRQLERDALAELVGELVAVNGPVNEADVARYSEEWR